MVRSFPLVVTACFARCLVPSMAGSFSLTLKQPGGREQPSPGEIVWKLLRAHYVCKWPDRTSSGGPFGPPRRVARSGPFEGWKGLEGATELLAARRPVAFIGAYTRSLCFGPGADSARLRHGAPAADYGRRGRRRADDPRRPGSDTHGRGPRPRRRSRQRARRRQAGPRRAPRHRVDGPPASRQPGRAGDRAARAARPRLAHPDPHPHRANRVVEAIVAGASGYILKTAPPEAIIAAVRATAAGESVISSQIAGKLLQRIRERDIPITTTSENAASEIRAVLTERELQIFERLASGRCNHDIARELSLSTNTVHNHVASILAKLHLDNRIQAAVQAVRSGIS